MIDLLQTNLILRARSASLVVATTGAISLSKTAAGYARMSGSFLDDGFEVGMDITPAGFPVNTVEVVTSVGALTLGTTDHARAAAAGSRSIIAGLPEGQSYANVSPSGVYKPTVGRAWVEENFVPATSRVTTWPRNIGHMEETGIYVIKWYVPAGVGSNALLRSIDALKALYAPGTTFAVGSNSVEVTGDPGPFAGQILPADDWAVCTLTIPWLARSRNAIAA